MGGFCDLCPHVTTTNDEEDLWVGFVDAKILCKQFLQDTVKIKEEQAFVHGWGVVDSVVCNNFVGKLLSSEIQGT